MAREAAAASNAEAQGDDTEPAGDDIFAEVDALDLAQRQDDQPAPEPAVADQQAVAVEHISGAVPAQPAPEDDRAERQRIENGKRPEDRQLPGGDQQQWR